ncbi:MAG: FtsQ-type POTRA domain-containing protein [Elusimicrobiota bacterium]|jgi:cell division protein FtsQ|nr:FtsQ-type POTRA domain-containing protein [Elusimicrobiota bacterium]
MRMHKRSRRKKVSVVAAANPVGTASFSKILLYLCLVLMVGLILFFVANRTCAVVYNCDMLRIEKIEITGIKNISKSEIIEVLPFDEGKSLLGFNASDVENNVKEMKREIKEIKISRWWKKVEIEIVERIPAVFLKQNGIILGLDFDNVPFPLRGFMEMMSLPTIECFKENSRKELLEFIRKFRDVCGTFFNDIFEIKLTKYDNVVFTARCGTSIIWGERCFDGLSEKFQIFQKVYANAFDRHKKIDYVDMSFYEKGRAIVKPAQNIEKN